MPGLLTKATPTRRAPGISRFSRWPVLPSHCLSISASVKNPPPMFGSTVFAQWRHPLGELATDRVADRAAIGHRMRLFQRERIETAVELHRGHAVGAAIGADLAGIIAGSSGRGKAKATTKRQNDRLHAERPFGIDQCAPWRLRLARCRKTGAGG
jgi:hypothetical protein